MRDRPVVFGTGLITLDLLMSENLDVIRCSAGGTCGNVLSLLAKFGFSSTLLARLNDDIASRYVKSDLEKCGVNIDFASLEPTAETPIITQTLHRSVNGESNHTYGWSCPNCGSSLPWYKPVHLRSVRRIVCSLEKPDYYFFDRASAASVELAIWAKSCGAIVIFEPSSKGDKKYFEEALSVTDILKYSNERFSTPINAISFNPKLQLEVQTRSEHGLIYRFRRFSRLSNWKTIKAPAIENFRESSGAGDWLTAGMIKEISEKTVQLGNYLGVVEDVLEASVRYGAWACQFEGARGGIYESTKSKMEAFINKNNLIELPEDKMTFQRAPKLMNSSAICPSCIK